MRRYALLYHERDREKMIYHGVGGALGARWGHGGWARRVYGGSMLGLVKFFNRKAVNGF